MARKTDTTAARGTATTTAAAAAADTPEGSGEPDHTSKMIPQTVLSLADACGLLDRGAAEDPIAAKLAPEAGEHEVDYAVRTLPIIGEAVSKQLSDLQGELAAAKRSLSSQKGAATKARNEVDELKEAAEPRSLGPVDDQLSTEELAELFAESAVEIAFSDGRRELPGVPSITVPPGTFRLSRQRLMPQGHAIQRRGPVDERGSRSLAGYALLIDGEQVAYAERLGGALILGPGQTYDLTGDILLR